MMNLNQVPLLPRPRHIHPEPSACPAPASDRIDALPPSAPLPAQGYRLAVAPGGIRLEAADPAGAFYGRMTLRQLLRACSCPQDTTGSSTAFPGRVPALLPCGVIEDSPDIPVRGVMLDISRDKVPTMATLFALIDNLAEWKVNHIQLYMEHTFAYRDHREVWADADPFTPDEIRLLDAYCRDRFIELAPNQNAFGHMERWLKHPRYRPLAECPEGFTTPSGEWRPNPSTLDPGNPGSLALVASLFNELVPCFTSRRLNIGCDETWELGKGRSRQAVERDGLHRVFLDYLGKLNAAAAPLGCTCQYWGDMVWNHFPDRLDLLDRGMVHVDWGYYRNYPFQAHGEKLAAAGIPFWFAPGTSTWCTFTGCNEAGYGSNRSAAKAALACGAAGLLNTDWGDGGHWHYLAISFTGFAAGAAMAWCEKTNPDDAIRAALDPHVFHDEAGVMGQAAYALADTWQHVSENATQSNLLDRILRQAPGYKPPANMTAATLAAAEAHLETSLASMAGARMDRPDGGLILDEFANNGRMALAACRMGRRLLAGQTPLHRDLAGIFDTICAEHRRLWLARNRPGGLDDSLRPFKSNLGKCQ
jgi:hypothetical protein